MVSLRHVREQEELALRRARYEEARRIGSALGVQRARAYATQKKMQKAKVRNDIRKQWECEVQQQAAIVDRIMYDGQAKLGEGMRAAADVMVTQRQHAIEELDAWSAEHILQRERHRVAWATECVTRALQEEPKRSIVERKRAVRMVEDKYSKTVIARPQPSPPNFAANGSLLAGALSPVDFRHTSPQMTTTTTNIVVVASADDVGNRQSVTRGDAAATQFSEERRRAMASAAKTVQKAQREAAERAAVLLSQREEAVQKKLEVSQRRAANVMALERRGSAETRTDTSFCAKELELRRAAAVKAQEEAEFEKVFLRGSLPYVDNLEAPAEKKSSGGGDGGVHEGDMCFFLPSSVSSLLPGDADVVVQLPPRPFTVRPYVEEAIHDVDDKATSEVGSDGPSATSFAPQPTPVPSQRMQASELTPSPVHTLRAWEEAAPVVLSLSSSNLSPSLSTTPAKANTTVVTDVTSTSGESPGLTLHHEYFLRNLKALQEKLAKAAESVGGNDTADAPAYQGNISLSTMSSFPTPSQVPGKGGECKAEYEATNSSVVDTSGSNSSSGSGSSSSMSSVYSRSYPTMTADQLKAALLRLKSRIRSA